MYVLVIEDNLDLVANLYDYLEPRKHVVDAAYNARRGLELVSVNRYDVIVLDLTLPDMDGLEVCAHIRKNACETPVLMLTARDTLDDKLAGFKLGADDYLVKPFAMPELEARLNALYKREKGHRSRETLQVSDLVYYPDTMRVVRAGHTISLPPIPLKILTYLMQHSPRVIPRNEIERYIWGNARPDSDSLKSHMSVLRSCIDRPFEHKLLRTVHGIGYQLAGDNEIQG